MASYNDDFSDVKRDMKKTYEKGDKDDFSDVKRDMKKTLEKVDKVSESQGWWVWALEKINSAKDVLIKLFRGDEKDKREGMKDDVDDDKQVSEKKSEEEDLAVGGFDLEEKMKIIDEMMIRHREEVKVIDETMMPLEELKKRMDKMMMPHEELMILMDEMMMPHEKKMKLMNEKKILHEKLKKYMDETMMALREEVKLIDEMMMPHKVKRKLMDEKKIRHEELMILMHEMMMPHEELKKRMDKMMMRHGEKMKIIHEMMIQHKELKKHMDKMMMRHEELKKGMDLMMMLEEEKMKLMHKKKILHDQESERTMIHEIVSTTNEFLIEGFLQHILANNNKKAVCIMMSCISKKWKEDFGDKTITVWLGSDYREGKKGEIVLVCFHTADTLLKRSNFLNLPVIYKNYDATEKEPLENRLLDDYQRVSFDANDAATIKALITRHGENLFKSHSNLEVISASSVKSKKSGIIKQTSILLYCKFKGIIPYGETLFPDKLRLNEHCYPTDVREGYFLLGMMSPQRQTQNPHPHLFNESLRMGCSIGTLGYNSGGTLGPFVRLDTNDIGFLTCAHVVGIGNSKGKSVVQPADIESGPQPTGNDRICGTVIKEIFDPTRNIGIDVALVHIDQNKRDAELGHFVWMDSLQLSRAGFGSDLPSFADGTVTQQPTYKELKGKILIKFGRTTGLTRGAFALDGAMFRFHDAPLSLPNQIPASQGHASSSFVMKGQMLVENLGNRFFDLGDSGAGVYVLDYPSEGKLALVGIAIGYITSGESVMTPIGGVLEALQLTENSIITETTMQTD